MSVLKLHASFPLNFALLFSFIRSNSSVLFFSWNCTWFGQREPIKVQNFGLSAAYVKFHQIYTLIGSFCWKYIKFQVKMYRKVMSYEREEWCKIWRKTDLLFQKWQEFDTFWPKHWKFSKICILISSYCAKNLMFDLKKYRGVIFHDTEEWFKIWRKTNSCFGKWHEELGTFSPEQWKVSKLGLWSDPFLQSRKSMSLKFTEELCVRNWLVVLKLAFAL